MREKGLVLPLVLVVLGIVAVGAIAYFQIKPKQQSQQNQNLTQPSRSPSPLTKKDESDNTTTKNNGNKNEVFQENIRPCVTPSNFSYQLYVTFKSEITSEEAKTILLEVDAYDISPKDANVYYFHLPDGKICVGVNKLKKSEKITIVDSVPWMPVAP